MSDTPAQRALGLPSATVRRFFATVSHPGLHTTWGLGWDHPEPPPADFPLLGLDNVLLTPHMAARTYTAVENMSWVVRDVLGVVEGRPPQFPAP